METFNPHPYQINAIQAMVIKPGFALFLDPGMGKTSTTLACVEIFRRHNAMRAALVIAPIRPLRNTWPAEVHKWTEFNGLRVSLALGTPAQRIAALREDADVYLINPENVAWLANTKEAFKALRADVLVVDESQKFKSHKAERFRALRALLPCFRRRFILTGTPAAQSLMDLWAQIFLLDNGQRLGRTITVFRNRWFNEIVNQWGGRTYSLKQGAEQEIFAAIADVCMRLSGSDYLTMPERVNNYIYVTLPADACKFYVTVNRDFGAEGISVSTAAALSMKLRQISNGAVYRDDGRFQSVHTAKLEALRDLIEEQQGQPLLVAVSYRHDVARIREYLDEPLPYLGGGVSTKVSDAIIARWNRREIPVLLAHPASVASGLNLQEGGRAMAWFGLSYSLEENIQMVSRIWRQGQKNACVIHYIIAQGTRDEDVIAAVAAKGEVQKRLFDALSKLQTVKVEQ